MSFIGELRRRNVIRVAIGYLAGAWLLLQIADIVLPRIGVSETAITSLIYIVAIGFVPAIVVSWFFEITPGGLKRDADATTEDRVTQHRLLDRAIIVVLLLALGFFAIDKFVLDPARDASDIEQAEEAARKSALIGSFGDKSIAVLPFTNMSSDPEQEYFSDGIAEELLNLLARINGLRVISRTSAFAFKGTDTSISDIAEQLDVVHVLEGSVRKSGNKIRITTQLIDARTDTHLWSETYDRELQDIFAIQDEVAEQIVDQLKITMSVGLTPVDRHDPHAYALYLEAAQMLEAKADLDRTEELLLEVLAIEPEYLDAKVDLSSLYRQRSDVAYRSSDIELYEQFEARRAEILDEVTAVDPDNIQLNIAQVWSDTANVQRAAPYLERALAADPYNSRGLNAAIMLMDRLWRPHEAVPIGEYVVRRDPLHGPAYWNLGRAALNAGNYELAEKTYRTIVGLNPAAVAAPWGIGLALLLQGKSDAALTQFEKPQTDETLRLHGKVLALHDLGRHDESDAALAALIELNDTSDESEQWPIVVGWAYSWIGDADGAFEYLEKQRELDSGQLRVWAHSPLYKNIEDDPRWIPFRESAEVGPERLDAVEFNPRLPPDLN